MWGETNPMSRQLTYTMESEKKKRPEHSSRNYCTTESSGNINTRMNTCDCNCFQSRMPNSNQQPTFDYLTDLQRLNLDINQINNNKMSNKSMSFSNSKNGFNNSNRKTNKQSYINNDSFLFSKYNSQLPEENVKRNNISIQENDYSLMKTMPNTNNSGRKTLSNLTISKINKLMNESLLQKIKNSNPQRKFNTNINNPQSIFSHYASSIPQGRSNFIHGSNLKTFNNSNSLFDSDKKMSDQPIEEGIENNQNSNENINNHSINNDQEKELMNFKTIDEFNAYLKEENHKLKKTNFAYKQLIDTLFYFVNSLSHKYSYNKTFFEIAYYVEHLDELTKSLLDLDKYIANTIDLSLIEKKHQELLSSLKITNEFQLTLPIVPEEKYKEKTLPTNKHQPIYSFGGDEEMKSDSKDRGKDGKGCVACLLGASVSQRGYSPMKCNPYKKYSTNDRILSPSKSLSNENSRSHSKNGHSKGKSTPRKNLKLVNS